MRVVSMPRRTAEPVTSTAKKPLFSTMSAPALLRAGWYDAEFAEAFDGPGNALTLYVAVFANDGARVVRDVLVDNAENASKIQHACQAAGAAAQLEAGEIQAADFRGKQCRVRLAGFEADGCTYYYTVEDYAKRPRAVIVGKLTRFRPVAMLLTATAVIASLSACAPGPAPYPTVGAYYPPYRPLPPPYPSAGTFQPPIEPQATAPTPEPLQRPDAALPAPSTPAPAPAPTPIAPTPAPSPGPTVAAPPPDSPVPTVDSRPPGTRCGWWEPCNLWE